MKARASGSSVRLHLHILAFLLTDMGVEPHRRHRRDTGGELLLARFEHETRHLLQVVADRKLYSLAR